MSVAGFIRRCMHTTVLGGAVLGVVAGVGLLVGGIAGTTTTPTSAAGSTTPHMRFASVTEGPADVCIDRCRQLIVASGMITADTPRQFAAFVNENSLQNTQAVVVLESDGGSVLGALDLGRAIRRFGLGTTVGRVIERRAKSGTAYGEVNTRADCQSMCTFVLLGGVERDVPRDARVLVHQIWLGDRRDDAVAASYTAEDLEVVQRDIGSIMQYTVEMGGDIELVALSLKVPPWEPMRALSRDELRRTRLIHAGETAEFDGRQDRGRPRLGRRQPVRRHQWPRLGHHHPERPARHRPHPSAHLRRRAARQLRHLHRLRQRRRHLRPDVPRNPLGVFRARPAARPHPGRADHG